MRVTATRHGVFPGLGGVAGVSQRATHPAAERLPGARRQGESSVCVLDVTAMESILCLYNICFFLLISRSELGLCYIFQWRGPQRQGIKRTCFLYIITSMLVFHSIYFPLNYYIF